MVESEWCAIKSYLHRYYKPKHSPLESILKSLQHTSQHYHHSVKWYFFVSLLDIKVGKHLHICSLHFLFVFCFCANFLCYELCLCAFMYMCIRKFHLTHHKSSMLRFVRYNLRSLTLYLRWSFPRFKNYFTYTNHFKYNLLDTAYNFLLYRFISFPLGVVQNSFSYVIFFCCRISHR